jgi:hypothetical protein
MWTFTWLVDNERAAWAAGGTSRESVKPEKLEFP